MSQQLQLSSNNSINTKHQLQQIQSYIDRDQQRHSDILRQVPIQELPGSNQRTSKEQIQPLAEQQPKQGTPQQNNQQLSPRLMQQAHQQVNQKQTSAEPTGRPETGVSATTGEKGGPSTAGDIWYNPIGNVNSQLKGSSGNEVGSQPGQSVTTKVGTMIAGGLTPGQQTELPASMGPTVGSHLQIHGHHSVVLKLQGRKSAGYGSIWSQNQRASVKNEIQKQQGNNLSNMSGINEFKQKVNMMLENQLYLDIGSGAVKNKGSLQSNSQKFEKVMSGGLKVSQGVNDYNGNQNGSQNQVFARPDPRRIQDLKQIDQANSNHQDYMSGFQRFNQNLNKDDDSLKNLKNSVNFNNQPSDPASGSQGRSRLGNYAKERSRDSQSLNSKNAIRQIGQQKNAQGTNIEQYQQKVNSNKTHLYSPINPANKFELDSKRISVANKDTDQGSDRSVEEPEEAQNGIESASDGMNVKSASSSNLLGEESRQSAQKQPLNPNGQAKGANEKDKRIDNLIASMPTNNSYSLNNQRQQQRRKLLFEYGLEKKLQNQAQHQNQQPPQPQQQIGNPPIEGSSININENKFMNQRLHQQQMSNQRNNGYMRLYELLDKLKTLNIDYLEAAELEQLRYLSAQYQYFLSQFQEYQINSKIMNNLKGHSVQAGPKPPNDVPRQSNFSHYSQDNHYGHSPQQKEKKDDVKQEMQMSHERFINNEKNLSNQRLQKSKKREEEYQNGEPDSAGIGLPILAHNSSQKKSPKSSTPMTIKKKDDNLLFQGTDEYQDQNQFTISDHHKKEVQVNEKNQIQSFSNQDCQNDSKKSILTVNEATQASKKLGQKNLLQSESASRQSLKRHPSRGKFQRANGGAQSYSLNSSNRNANNAIYKQSGEYNNLYKGEDLSRDIASLGFGSASDVHTTNREQSISPGDVLQVNKLQPVQGGNQGNQGNHYGYFNNELSSTTGSSSKNAQFFMGQNHNGYPIKPPNNTALPGQSFYYPPNANGSINGPIGGPQQFISNSPGKKMYQVGIGGVNYAMPNFTPPQMSVQDIKNMTNIQRINIFKHLQKREKTKFINIQQQKMQNMGINLDEKNKRTQRNKNSLDQHQHQRFGKQANGKFLDIVKRQAYNTAGGAGSRSANHAANPLTEQARRQWISDMKAFGVFQQNELWQFGQMNEAQQKQILICNLQQGKFQGIFDEQYNQMQQQVYQQQLNIQQQMLYQRNVMLNQPNQPQNTPHLAQKSPLTYGSALSAMDSIQSSQQMENKFEKPNNQDNKNSIVGQATLKDALKAKQGNEGENSVEESGDDQNKPSISTIDKTINMQVKNINHQNMQIVIENDNKKDNNEGGEPGEDQLLASPVANDAGDLPKTQPITQLNTLNVQNVPQNQSQNTQRNERVSSPSNLDNPGDLYFQANKNQTSFNMDDMDIQREHGALGLGIARRPMGGPNEFNPVQSKYEESKAQFESYLVSILERYQEATQDSNKSRHGPKNQHKIGIEHILPNLPKYMFSGQSKDYSNYPINPIYPLHMDIRNSNYYQVDGSGKFVSANNMPVTSSGYQSQVLSASNKDKARMAQQVKQKNDKINSVSQTQNKTNKVQNQKSDTEAKKKEGQPGQNSIVPDSTKNKKQNGETPENKEEENTIQEEVKKPRYFPPRRIPNPFEKAAQEQEQFLQARKEALAKYSNISKNRFKQDESQPLKYCIRPGNNSKLIIRVLERSGRLEPKYDPNDGDAIMHPGWEPADDHYDSLYNFKWKPTSGGIKYDLISKHGLKQLVNHVKGHGQLTTKDNLFLNMKAYYESQKMNIFDVVPLTLVVDYLKDDVGDKVEQFQSIMKLIERNLDHDVDFINQKLHESQYAKEKSHKTSFKLTECCHNHQNLWLLKPTGFNRGIGIHIFRTFDELRDIMCQYYGIGRGARDKSSIFQTHNHNHNQRENGTADDKQMRNYTFVIQKLIEKPRLYLKRKFDIRAWVLYNAADGKVYLFNEPYVRTSSKEYVEYDPEIPSEEQIFMQLTNNAIQRDNEDYGKFEEGNIVSVSTLFQHIADDPQHPCIEGKTKDDLESSFRQSMIKLISDSMKSVKGKFLQQRYTFELLGYDFILDEQMNTILIEVNTNPCLEESNKLLRCMLPRMVDNLFCIVMDPLFGQIQENGSVARVQERYKSKFPLPGSAFQDGGEDEGRGNPHPGYKDDENLWKYIYTLEY